MNALKLATLNIKGLHTNGRMGMLHDIFGTQEIHILFLQKFTNPTPVARQGIRHKNVGTERRGTAFMARSQIQLDHKTPFGSGTGGIAQRTKAG